MPLYDTSSTTLKKAIYPGDTQTLQSAEKISANNTAGLQINVPNSVYQPAQGISYELIFSGNPGTFEMDIQDATTDTDGAYQSITNAAITTASAGSDGKYYARFELTPFVGKWTRPFWKTLVQNNATVTVTVNISRP